MSRTLKEVVQLRSAPVTEFSSILKKIEEDTPYNVKHYEPAILAVRNYHQSPSGDINIIEHACANLELAIANAVQKRDLIRPRSNLEVLRGYRENHAKPFRPLLPGLPANFHSYKWEVNGLVITAKPHLLVAGKDGRIKYVYLSTTKAWDAGDMRFAANLLGAIITKNIPTAAVKDIELLECRNGEVTIGKEMGKRDLAALHEMAAILKDRGLN
jgi:hypothetical protein